MQNIPNNQLDNVTGGAATARTTTNDALLQQLFRLALPLRERAARAFDVRACARMAAVEEERARPDVDGELVALAEIMVEAGEEELFDLRVAIRHGRLAVRM